MGASRNRAVRFRYRAVSISGPPNLELLSNRALRDIEALSAATEDGQNPRDVKFELAEVIISRFHDKGAAERAKAEFISRFQKGAMPAAPTYIRLADDSVPGSS